MLGWFKRKASYMLCCCINVSHRVPENICPFLTIFIKNQLLICGGTPVPQSWPAAGDSVHRSALQHFSSIQAYLHGTNFNNLKWKAPTIKRPPISKYFVTLDRKKTPS